MDDKEDALTRRCAELERELETARDRAADLDAQVQSLLRTEDELHRAQVDLDAQLRRISDLNDTALRWDSSTTPDDVIADVIALLKTMFALDDVKLLVTDETAEALELSRTPRTLVDRIPPHLAAERVALQFGEIDPYLAEVLDVRHEEHRVAFVVPIRSRGETVGVIGAIHSDDKTRSYFSERPDEKHEPLLGLLAGHLDHGLAQAKLTHDLRAANERLQATVNKLETTQNQLLQTSKLEAVGRLAGGIAHDFNNLLTVILSYSTFALSEAPHAAADLVQIVGAAERAALLTNQLLAFSRQQERSLVDLDLNAVVQDLARMLQRVLGEDVNLTLDLGGDLPLVRADRGQMDQMLLNLVVNARDAVGLGGSITVRTRKTYDLHATPPEVVVLSVEDNGAGMPPEVVERVFEPFFTTKEVGMGTGMGLSMVYGIVKQAGGKIEVWSEPGTGSRFDIFYPAAEARTPTDESIKLHQPSTGTETILVVEDEPKIRALVERTLRSGGYAVFVAADGEEALRVADECGHIDLLMTDVIMPKLGGVALTRELRRRYAGLPTLLVSGYPADHLEQHGLDADTESYLAKPFTPSELLARVRRLLDRSGGLSQDMSTEAS